jgi:hypothetical protein
VRGLGSWVAVPKEFSFRGDPAALGPMRRAGIVKKSGRIEARLMPAFIESPGHPVLTG